jgi:hypothetical protein
MPTLGTQNIATSYPQLLKTFTVGGIDGSAQVITDGDNTSSALSISTSEVQSTGSFTVSSNSRLLGPVTFGTNITASTGTSTIGTLFASGLATFGTSFTASTGTATIGTLSASTATISTATISTATIPLQLGNVTFGSNITASTGTATIGTATISTATISTATIPTINGVSTFATGFTSSTGTNTLGTIASTTINNTGLATVGTLQVGTSGTAPKITNVSYGTFAFSGGTVQTHANNDTTTGTFGLPCQLGDIVIASINSLGSTTGTGALISTSFFPIATDVVEYNIIGKGTTAGTIPAGVIFATAMRFTA